MWPLFFCGAEGKALGLTGDEQDCEVGSSGGNNYCPTDVVTIQGRTGGIGCGPPIDTKFELGTFGCTSADRGRCRVTPQGQSLFDISDSWDTNLVRNHLLKFRNEFYLSRASPLPRGHILETAIPQSCCIRFCFVQVDGWTVPFTVDVLDNCTASDPTDNRIDCFRLSPLACPTNEVTNCVEPFRCPRSPTPVPLAGPVSW